MKREQRNIFHFYQKEIRKIIIGWNLIQDLPKNENNKLVQKIIDHFTNDRENAKLHDIIESYFIIDLGFYSDEIDILPKIEELYVWWESKQ